MNIRAFGSVGGMLVTAVALLLGCDQRSGNTPSRRAELVRLGGNVVQIVPSEGQLPWCLAFTISERTHVVRQLTMSRRNHSFACGQGTPIGNRTFLIPVEEGPVKIYVFFSDVQLEALPIAHQLFDLASRPALNILDLRAPGKFVVERFDFIPEEEPGPSSGGVIGAGGEVEDGGSSK